MKTKRVPIVDDEFFIVKALAMNFANSDFAAATARGQRIGGGGGEGTGIDAFMSEPFSPGEMVAKAAALIGEG